MYTKEQLEKYPYFEALFKSRDISNVIDALTGLVSRRHMIGFIRHLVENKVPFTLAMMDLDNFKFINDTYGHEIGDGVLAGVSGDLVRYLEEYGIAGRFGGDEFLIVNFRDHSYDAIKAFFAGLYSDYNVLRKNIFLGDCEPFVTGTIGSAVFLRMQEIMHPCLRWWTKPSIAARQRAETAISFMWNKCIRISPFRHWPAGESIILSLIWLADLILSLPYPVS